MKLDPFYLIVGNVDLLARLVPLGVRLVQLRIKDQTSDQIDTQVAKAKVICERYGALLVVNDHWQTAIDNKCPAVHLGQEDMDTADFTALRRAGVKIGLSTHDTSELDRALLLGPDYVALGPIYPTRLKKMAWAPQGLDRLRDWKQMAKSVPVVGIGGLTPTRLPDAFATGMDSAAVVTDIAMAVSPEDRCREWIAVTGAWR